MSFGLGSSWGTPAQLVHRRLNQAPGRDPGEIYFGERGEFAGTEMSPTIRVKYPSKLVCYKDGAV